VLKFEHEYKWLGKGLDSPQVFANVWITAHLVVPLGSGLTDYGYFLYTYAIVIRTLVVIEIRLFYIFLEKTHGLKKVAF